MTDRVPEQLRIEQAIAERLAREGMDRSLDRANRETPDWSDLALDYLRRYARQHREFPGWFVTDSAALDPNFPAPANSRAWGGVWKRAKKEGIVVPSGRWMAHPKRHGCPCVIWRSNVLGESA